MILSLCQWAQNTAFFTAIRGSWNVYPVVMATHLLGIALRGRYRGQRQKWLAMRFLGEDSDINVHTAEPEFAQ